MLSGNRNDLQYSYWTKCCKDIVTKIFIQKFLRKGQKFSRFLGISDIFAKVCYLEHANLRILESFFSWNLPRQLFAKVYSEFSIALLKAGRSFNHQKVGLIYSALSELLLFFLKHDMVFLFLLLSLER